MADANPPDHVGPLSAVRDLPGACFLSRRTDAGYGSMTMPQRQSYLIR
jgi:hypothetical protein